MSTPEGSTNPDNAPPPAPSGGGTGWLGCLMIVIGIVLLLPGLCSLVVGGMMLSGGERIGEFGVIFLITFAIAFGGIMLIRAALRR